jgi:hypothetical protein
MTALITFLDDSITSPAEIVSNVVEITHVDKKYRITITDGKALKYIWFNDNEVIITLSKGTKEEI